MKKPDFTECPKCKHVFLPLPTDKRPENKMAHPKPWQSERMKRVWEKAKQAD